jgi:hypothetical protein
VSCIMASRIDEQSADAITDSLLCCHIGLWRDSLLLLNSFYALPSFLNRFGIRAPNGALTIPPSWQNALSNGGLAGQISE